LRPRRNGGDNHCAVQKSQRAGNVPPFF